MLSSRFENDGKNELSLNSLQLGIRDCINAKIASGTYEFESISCELCGDSETETLAEKDRYGLQHPVVICRECGLIYTSPRMTQASYAQFYDLEYRELYHGKEHPIAELFKANLGRGRRIAKFLRSIPVSLEGKRVLEVGCGAGGILAYLRDTFGCDVKGCDFGSEGVNYGVSQHGLDLEVGDLASITLSWKPDIIIYSHVLEHVLELKDECSRIRNVLDEEGTVYIEVPSVKGIRENYDWNFLKYLQNAHTYHFTLATLTNLMDQCGFELLKGNEFTQSAFRPASASRQSEVILNDYGNAMQFLESTEQKRRFGSLFHRLRNSPRKFAAFCVKRLGLATTVERFRKK